MNKITAILLLAVVAVQAKYIRNVALPDTKIIGGTDAQPGQFPYQCHLTIRVGSGSFFCGCSILTDTWVLTAAHCVDTDNLPASNITVYLGDTVRSNTAEAGEENIVASYFKRHEAWRPNVITNDVAVIQLSKPATLSSTVGTICLAPNNTAENAFDGQIATVSGWGKDRDVGSVTDSLKYVDVEVLDYDTCNAAFPLAYSRSNICTSIAGNKGTCNGDSGGPLVVEVSGKKQQIGIVSFGSGRGCTSEPSVFTRVSSFRSWIETNTLGASIC